MLKRILGQLGGSRERSGSFQSAIDALEGDELVFSSAKKRAMETGQPQTFVINNEKFETSYDGATNHTISLGPDEGQTPAVNS